MLYSCATPTRLLKAVSLPLNFTQQFKFAGYYVAIEPGYCREAGLEVTLVEGSSVPLAEAALRDRAPGLNRLILDGLAPAPGSSCHRFAS
ncbi:ABC transporter substrate-binding protein [Janthinobacterium sp. ROICE36]|uniref:ABC transporter substrate-binding protein n=1 Tax=Janthinobacterium sp. ROICE36 TaxID=2048670 RepID=UPI0011AF4AF1|nr:ABC transporter substrate-binding protein [Janthinobacterium sp. ROICE36]